MNARTEWLERRRAGIGGSDVAGILGLSPWSSPWSVWADKVGLVSGDKVGTDQMTDAMEFGQRAEPMMAGYFEDRTGLILAGEQMELQHPDNSWMRCTVDGLVYDDNIPSDEIDRFMPAVEFATVGDGCLGVHEIKTTSSSASEWENSIPAHYQCQAQWSLAVSGLERVWFSVLHLAFGRPKYAVYELERDQADIDLIVKKCRAFWHDCVLTGNPPEPDAHPATTAAINAAWPDADGQMDEDDQVRFLLDSIREIDDWKEKYRAEGDHLRNQLRALMRDNTEVVDGNGRPLITFRHETRTLIDAVAVRKEHGDKFDTTSTNRILRIPAFRRKAS